MSSQQGMGQRRLRLALLGATALMGGLCGMSAFAQDTTAAAPEAKADETIIVTGFRQSYANAVKSKKNNIEITDGISSDGLGRFPDLNVGEALQRVPGIQINREAEGRNASIGLRGMPGYFARTTLNGQAFAEPPVVNTTGGADSTPLGAFNSDIFTAFVIEKSPMANAQSGGLSGNIDMQIAPALGRKDGGFAKASMEYNQLGGKTSPAFTLGYNKHLSSDFAIFGTLAYKKEDFRRDTLRPNGYSRLSPSATGMTAAQFASAYGQFYGAATTGATCAGGPVTCDLAALLGTSAYNTSTTGSASTKGVYYLNQIRQYVRVNEGDLWTASGGMEWKPNDNTKLGVVGYYTDRNLPNTTQYFQINEPWGGTIATNGTPVVLSDGRALAQSITISNYFAKASTRLYSQHQASKGLVANLEWKNEDWRLAGVLTTSGASNSSVESEFDLQTQSFNGPLNGLTNTLSVGDGTAGGFSQVVGSGAQNKIFNWAFADITSTGVRLADRWNWNANDPENLVSGDGLYTLNVSGSESFAKNNVDAAQFDVERNLNFGPITSIQGGLRFENDTYDRHGFRNMAYGIKTENITQSMLITPPGVSDFMNGETGVNTNWQTIDAVPFLNAITPVTAYNGGGLSAVGLNINYKDGAYATNNYHISNKLAEAYLQVKFETNVLGHRIRGNAGVRDEETQYQVDTLAQKNAFVGPGSASDFSWISYKNKYHHILPSAIVVADITDDMVLRAAFYKTYVRPLPQTSNPVGSTTGPSTNASLSSVSTVVKDYNVALGASRLKPYTADSLDLSWEWYNRPNGVISLAYFKKTLHNRVEGIADPAILCPSDGGTYGFGALSWDGQYCTATSLTTTAAGVTTKYHVNVNGQYNVDKATNVEGLEFNIQQNFDFLPGFWKNFGGDFNYAFTTAKQTGSGAAAAPFPGISKFTYNTILYYETPKFGIRGVYNWRSWYPLTSAGTYTGNSRNADSRGQLDLSASYNLSDRVTLSLDAYNLTNEIRKEYEVDQNFVRWLDYDGRTYTFTVRATF